ncbi:MAG: ROK family transcriptional regulator, partial [Candidatus Atribacteria bacterium]|nr:ROK family transcriptional regulator [Candidatus Atribacteria bacterium]
MEKRKSFTKTHYKATIKRLIYENGSLSRTEIQKKLGIRPASITQLTKELIKEKILIEKGFGNNQKGKKQRLLTLNPIGGTVIGIEFDPQSIRGLLIDLENKIIGEKNYTLPEGTKGKQIIELLKNIIHQLIHNNSLHSTPLLGIGIADPGLVDQERGISLFCSQIADWRDVPLRQILEKEFQLPISIEGNTNCKLLAESLFGAGRDFQNQIYVDLSYGVGASLMTHGAFYYGAQGLAGELGHIQYNKSGPICSCGNHGCLEMFVSSSAVIRSIQNALEHGVISFYLDQIRKKTTQISIASFIKAANENDKFCISLVEEMGRTLGEVIANVVNLLNPEAILIGGELADLGDLILNPIKGTVRRQSLELATRNLSFKVAEIKDRPAARGAASLVL